MLLLWQESPVEPELLLNAAVVLISTLADELAEAKGTTREEELRRLQERFVAGPSPEEG